MILLPQQFQALVYHLAAGWIFGLCFNANSRILWPLTRKMAAAAEICFYVLFVTVMYAGLYQINGGVTQLYLLATFGLGVWLYTAVYARTFQPFFDRWGRSLKQVFIYLSLALKKISSIIKLRLSARKKRKARERNEKKAKRKQKREQKAKKKEEPVL